MDEKGKKQTEKEESRNCDATSAKALADSVGSSVSWIALHSWNVDLGLYTLLSIHHQVWAAAGRRYTLG